MVGSRRAARALVEGLESRLLLSGFTRDQAPLMASPLYAGGTYRIRPVAAVNATGPDLSTYPTSSPALRLTQNSLYDGNTPTPYRLTPPVLPGQTRQVDVTIGDATGRTAERLGINVGSPDFYSQTNPLSNLLVQSGGFERANGRIPVHVTTSAAGSSTTRQLVVAANWLWQQARYADMIGQALLGVTGADKDTTRHIVAAADQLDASGKPTGNTLLTLDADLPTVPAADDMFLIDFANYGGYKLADTVSGWGTYSVTRTDAVAHAGQCSAMITLGAASWAWQNAASLANYFAADQAAGRNVLQTGHVYQMAFWAKADVAATATLRLYQGANGTQQDVTLLGDGQWHQYTLTFDMGTRPPVYENAIASLAFTNAAGPGQTIYVDDWTLVDTSDVIPGSALSASMVSLLQDYGFGQVRYWHPKLESARFDDLIGPASARMGVLGTDGVYDPQFGLPEMLEMAKRSNNGAAWIVLPPTWTGDDAAHFMEYLAGPTSTPYGAKRVADGHPGSWLDDLPRLQLEAGDESWNSTFFPYAGSPFEPYLERAQDLFTALKASPYYAANAGKLTLIVNGWQWVPWYTNHAIDLVPAADAVSVSSYLGGVSSDVPRMTALYDATLTDQTNANATEYPSTIFRKKVEVYEMNAGELGGGVPVDKQSQWATGLGAALAVAHQSMILSRDYGISNQNLFTLIQRGVNQSGGYVLGNYGLFADMTTARTNPRPTALAAKLLNRAAGTIYGSSVSANGWAIDGAASSSPAGSMPAADAMVSFDGQRIVVTMLNETVADDQDTVFHLKLPASWGGVTLRPDWSKASFQVLAGASINANNETGANVFIGEGGYRHSLREVYAALPGHAMGSLVIPVVQESGL